MEHQRFLAEARPSFTSDESQHLTLDSGRNHLQLFYCCIFILKLSIQFSSALLELPLVRLIERAVCRTYLSIDADEIEERLCKTPLVQNKVAIILGYKLTFDALPCLCLLTSLRKILLANVALYRYPDCLILRIAFKLMGKKIRDDVVNHWPVLGLFLDSIYR